MPVRPSPAQGSKRSATASPSKTPPPDRGTRSQTLTRGHGPGSAAARAAGDHSRISPLGGGCLVAGGRGLLAGGGLGGRGLLAGVAERGGGLGGGGLGGLLDGAGGLQRLGERVCLGGGLGGCRGGGLGGCRGGGLGGCRGGGAVGDLAPALVFGMTTGLACSARRASYSGAARKLVIRGVSRPGRVTSSTWPPW